MEKVVGNQKGMSLIELMVVVAIFGVMLIMASFGADFLQNHRLSSSSKQFLGDLLEVRKDALTRTSTTTSKGFGIRFASNTSYVMFEFDSADFGYDGTTEEISIKTKSLPDAVTVTVGASGDPTQPPNHLWIYDKRGLMRDENWLKASDRTYVLRIPGASSDPRCVNVTQVMIREGIWNGTNCIEN